MFIQFRLHCTSRRLIPNEMSYDDNYENVICIIKVAEHVKAELPRDFLSREWKIEN